MNRGTNHNLPVILITVALLIISAAESSAGQCDVCHKSPPDDPAHWLHSGLEELTPAYGDTSITMASGGPAQAYGFNCGNCHPFNEDAHKNGAVDISLDKYDAGLNTLNASDSGFDPEKNLLRNVLPQFRRILQYSI